MWQVTMWDDIESFLFDTLNEAIAFAQNNIADPEWADDLAECLRQGDDPAVIFNNSAFYGTVNEHGVVTAYEFRDENTDSEFKPGE